MSYRSSRISSSHYGPPPYTAPPDEVVAHKLWVGQLHPQITELQLVRQFRQLGTVKHFHYFWHTHGERRGTPRGYCYVEYADREEAKAAMDVLRSKKAGGRPLVVDWAIDHKAAVAEDEAREELLREGKPVPRVAPQPIDKTKLSRSDKIRLLEAQLSRVKQSYKKGASAPSPSAPRANLVRGAGAATAQASSAKQRPKPYDRA